MEEFMRRRTDLAGPANIAALAGLALFLAACGGGGQPPVADDPAPAIADGAATAEDAAAPADDAASGESTVAVTETPAEDAASAADDAPGDSEGPTPAVAAVETFDPSVAACGPAGTVATAPSTGGAASGSLFDVASASDATGDATGDNGGRIAVDASRGRSFLRFGNPNTAPRSRGTTGKRRISHKVADLAGTWRLADGSPGCTCSVTLERGEKINPARATGCAASGIDNVASWRVRGSEIVLLAADRTLLGSLYSNDGAEFRGGLSNGTRAILWR
jgi:hypothetical protein